MRINNNIFLLFIVFLIIVLTSSSVHAACPGTAPTYNCASLTTQSTCEASGCCAWNAALLSGVCIKKTCANIASGSCTSCGCSAAAGTQFIEDAKIQTSSCGGSFPDNEGSFPTSSGTTVNLCVKRSDTVGLNRLHLISQWHPGTSCGISCSSELSASWTPSGTVEDSTAEICWILCKNTGTPGVLDANLVSTCVSEGTTPTCGTPGYNVRGQGWNSKSCSSPGRLSYLCVDDGGGGPANTFNCDQCKTDNTITGCAECCMCGDGTGTGSPPGGGGGEDVCGDGRCGVTEDRYSCYDDCYRTKQLDAGDISLNFGLDAITGFLIKDVSACPNNDIIKQECKEIYTIHSGICGCGEKPSRCELRDNKATCEIEGTNSDCAWCHQPSGSNYPYTLFGLNSSETEGCINTTWDPLNCGGCGFNDDGTNTVFSNGKGFCPRGTPLCVDTADGPTCMDKSDALAAGVTIPDYLIESGAFNPVFDYTATESGGAWSSSWASGTQSTNPTYLLDDIDHDETICQAATTSGIFLEGIGCCGDGKCREQKGVVCGVTAICDGTSWHTTTDPDMEGEVFVPTSCTEEWDTYPVANINGEYIRCVDKEDAETYMSRYSGAPGMCGEGSVRFDTDLRGGFDYICGPGKYTTSGFRAVNGRICAGHGLYQSDVEEADLIGLEYVCDIDSGAIDDDIFAFASIVDATSIYSVGRIGTSELAPDVKYEYCPATVNSWLSDDGTPARTIAILPCPGRISIPSESINGFFYAGMDRTWGFSLGGDDHTRRLVVCRDKVSENDNIDIQKLTALDYYVGEGRVMGDVKGRQYMCYTDGTMTAGIDVPARAKIGVCCGVDGCGSENIPGNIGSGGSTYSPGQYVNVSGNLVFCLNNGSWTFDLDSVEMQEECEVSFSATGEFCCAESDDTSTWINESYNDPGSLSGACFKGVPQFNNVSLFYNDVFYSSVFVSNGTFYGCGFNDSMFVSEYNVTEDPSLLIPTGGVVASMDSITGMVSGNSLSTCVKECIVEMCAKTAVVQKQCKNNCPLTLYNSRDCKRNVNDDGSGGVCDWDADFDGANPRKDCTAWCNVAATQCAVPCNNGAHYVGWKCFPGVTSDSPFYNDYPLDCRRCTYPIMHANDEVPWSIFDSCGMFEDVSKGTLCDLSSGGNLSKDCLQNVEDWPNPGTGCNSTRTASPLIKQVDYCTVIDTPSGRVYCSFDDSWNDTYGTNPSHASLVPEPLFDYFNQTFIALGADTSNFRDAGCCEMNECWNVSTSTCIPEQINAEEFYQVNSTAVYKCLGGEWLNVLSEGKSTPDGCYVGHCPAETQCLVSITGDPNQNGMVYRNADPQCINHLQYFGDSFCINGEWSTRTKFLALKMASLVGTTEDFALMCGPGEDVLINTKSQNVGRSTNFCVLDLSGQRIIGTTLNELLYNISAPGNDFIGALQEGFLGVYDGMDVQFTHNCDTGTDNFDICVDLKDSRGEEILRLYYDDNLSMVIFSNEEVTLSGGLGATICSNLPAWLKWLCPNPSVTEQNLESLTLFNKTYAARKGTKEVFGVGERVCNKTTIEKEWVYSFNYTGFSSVDLSDLVNHIDADLVIVTDPNKHIYVENPKHDAWLALTLLRNTDQE